MPKYTTDLACFNKPVSFHVPEEVIRSTTADIVRTGKTEIDQQAMNFIACRNSNEYLNARTAWQNAHIALECPVPGSNPSFLMQDLEQTTHTYRNLLKVVAHNGIWNCGEFADFALLEIDLLKASGQFKEHYKAKVVSLNNPQIPENQQYRNHDHAFVLITDKQDTPVFIIDLWQSLVKNVAFAGTVDAYIKMLRATPDGQYVRADVVLNHIKQVTEISTHRASGDCDQSGYHKALHYVYGPTPTAKKIGERTDVESFLRPRMSSDFM